MSLGAYRIRLGKKAKMLSQEQYAVTWNWLYLEKNTN